MAKVHCVPFRRLVVVDVFVAQGVVEQGLAYLGGEENLVLDGDVYRLEGVEEAALARSRPIHVIIAADQAHLAVSGRALDEPAFDADVDLRHEARSGQR